MSKLKVGDRVRFVTAVPADTQIIATKVGEIAEVVEVKEYGEFPIRIRFSDGKSERMASIQLRRLVKRKRPKPAELLHVYGTTFSDLDEANIELAKARETIRQLNKEIDDLIKTDNETIRSLFAYQAKRDETIRQLRARLDEYERAPTVATVGHHYADTYRIFGTPPPVGTELIARPTRKDGE